MIFHYINARAFFIRLLILIILLHKECAFSRIKITFFYKFAIERKSKKKVVKH